ncbi:MAG: hypothetical protein RLY71_1700 [Pseudomonadota bacterium]|jgi:hypothetical protein
MRLPTETGLAVVLAVVIATSFAQCVAHGSGNPDPPRGRARPAGATDAADGNAPAAAHDPASAAPRLRCPSGLGRASDISRVEPPDPGGQPLLGDGPIRLLSCR